ncbi:MAG: hypothetical protein HZA35_00730 [Parcubacteria group bacterium]|nr:hypothetical protein [Parcubacteria group bacterium]
MTRKDVDLLLEYQTCSVAHPLTCGNDSGHLDLYPYLDTATDVITLICVNCDYTQVVDEELMAAIRMALPGVREIQKALGIVPIMREKLKDDE